MKRKRQAAQGSLEYALILLLIAVAAIITMQIMGISVQSVYCRVAGGLGVSNCAASAICQDDFNNISNELLKYGTWQFTNGQICNINNNYTGGMLYNKCSMNGSLSTSDYTASLNGADLASGNGYGIMFRTSDTGSGLNGYAFQYDPGLGGFVMRKWVNGAEITPPLAQKSYSGYNWYAQTHNLSVKVVGNTFTGYVDGQVVLTGTDPNNTYPSGGTAIRTWDSTNVCIDQFTLNSNTP